MVIVDAGDFTGFAGLESGITTVSVLVTDDAGNTSDDPVEPILDTTPPEFTSGSTAGSLNENSGASQVVYTATASDAADISAGVTFSLKPVGDFAALSINSATGEVRLTGNPNYEGQSSYSFTVLASDGVNPASEQAVSLSIVNVDEVAPSITSGSTAGSLNENSGASQVVYTATASDAADISAGVTFSLKPVGDFAALSINSATGEVRLTGNPNYEGQSSYSFTVLASDGVNPASEQAVSLSIVNVDEVAPSITSGSTAGSLNENSGASQVVYTATASDAADISAGVTFSLKPVGDFAALSINSATGEVRLTGNPNYEGQSSYSFTVLASDGVNPASEQAVSLSIVNVDEVAPSITSGSTAGSLNENSGASQVVYTATASDAADISAGVTFSLKPVGDFAALSINSATGEVRLTGNPNYEGQSSYSFTVLASDGVNPASEQAVSLSIVNVDEVAPSITSGSTAGSLNENSGASQVVYTATASDAADISAGVTFSLKPVGDFAALSINSATGEVRLTGNPNYEGQSSYSFTVLASDGVNPASEQAVSLSIVNVDEVAPSITSGSTAGSLNENSGASQVVYTATASDAADISAGVTFSLKPVATLRR